MTIQARYRDINREQANRCYSPSRTNLRRSQLPTWEEIRGKEVVIVTPPYLGQVDRDVICKGPFYAVAGNPAALVCPHIAEIGD